VRREINQVVMTHFLTIRYIGYTFFAQKIISIQKTTVFAKNLFDTKNNCAAATSHHCGHSALLLKNSLLFFRPRSLHHGTSRFLLMVTIPRRTAVSRVISSYRRIVSLYKFIVVPYRIIVSSYCSFLFFRPRPLHHGPSSSLLMVTMITSRDDQPCHASYRRIVASSYRRFVVSLYRRIIVLLLLMMMMMMMVMMMISLFSFVRLSFQLRHPVFTSISTYKFYILFGKLVCRASPRKFCGHAVPAFLPHFSTQLLRRSTAGSLLGLFCANFFLGAVPTFPPHFSTQPLRRSTAGSLLGHFFCHPTWLTPPFLCCYSSPIYLQKKTLYGLKLLNTSKMLVC
jgi:hypothetical protein